MNEKRRSSDYSDLNGRERVVPLLGIYNPVEIDSENPDIRGDRANIAILLLLYLLQGIPLGLTAALPMLLQNRGANYTQQAGFSFAWYPFSLKLLWAPIVDALFWSRFGRRKSWLVPTQYLIGISMILLSLRVNHWLEREHLEQNIPILTATFFTFNFLAATQDIAVDGWALTMLKRCNVGYASTCNTAGQMSGYFIGYTVFIALESKEFCNAYLRSVPQDDGLITLTDFLRFWGICFLITTTLIAFLKKEQDRTVDKASGAKKEPNIIDSYKSLWKIVNLRPIKIFAAVLLTVAFTFAACDNVSSLKLVEAGISKDKLAIMATPMELLQLFLPLFVVKYTTGAKPMNVFIKAIPFQILFSIFQPVIVWLIPHTLTSSGDVPIYIYALIIVNNSFYQMLASLLAVAAMAFFAKISDPAAGGTYMTLFNAIGNFGYDWPSSIVLWLVDVLTWKKCSMQSEPSFGFTNNTCLSTVEEEECGNFGGHCETSIDGYYLVSLICLIYGLCWYKWGTSQVRYLQSLPLNVWSISKSNEREMISIKVQPENSNLSEIRTNVDETTTSPTFSGFESNDLMEENGELQHHWTKNGTSVIANTDRSEINLGDAKK